MIELPLLMFAGLILLIFAGIPVAFSMLIVSFVVTALHFGFMPQIVNIFVQKTDEVASNYVLGAVPLFILMGSILERSGIAERLLSAVQLWTHRLPGGLAAGTIVLCIIFAAVSGVIGATESVVGLIAIPTMMRHNYARDLIAGTICAGGSLGTIIPPSVIVILLAPVANVDVGYLFMGIMVPGLCLALLYLIYVVVRCALRPQDGWRPVAVAQAIPLAEKLRVSITALVPPLLLIFAVLGSIVFGLATPTEAAAVGAAGAFILALGSGTLTSGALREAALSTVSVTAMITLILLAGNIFASVFSVSGGLAATERFINSLNTAPMTIVLLLLLVAFVAGFVLDIVSIILILIPIAIPVVMELDIHGLEPPLLKAWFCVVFLVTVQTSYLTPPLAPAIFYLRAIAPPQIRLRDMYVGVVPFIAIQLILVLSLLIFPALALGLPTWIRGM
ncbi:TRAP transporter large permease subunit [Roseovarius atlanticus]|uniref:TRAP transporter large permease n=1 Tax=Roseovarius atlanticus TaxID=1641875 RepID=UPI001C94AD55|nr:TRAP transporter large permease subunit [Roseovarius atlanticus]MBY5989145.1 TRAP transporter large permease subunit [Roseovarius atlanticus]MBY6124537.1 TRAP transporter large permease subunit [Roseovarius atlanticus]MBY6149032.1 TRAP transporter large permease subunit [Roseovarius atlanticus]